MIGITLQRNKVLNFIIVSLSIICALFFSFLPFVYIFNYINIDKRIFFFAFIVIVFSVILLRWVLNNGNFEPRSIIVVTGYLIFACYSLVSFYLTEARLDDTKGIFSITVMNSIFVLLAINSRNNPRLIVQYIFLFTSVYIIIGVVNLSTGTLLAGAESFQAFFSFSDEENRLYQNVNTYLGLYIVAAMSLLLKRRGIIQRAAIVLSCVFGFFLMIQIGGKAGLLAVVLVVGYMLASEFKWKMKYFAYSFAVVILMGLVFVSYYSTITDSLSESLAFKRFAVLFEGGDSSDRLFLFSSAIELFLASVKNFVFGGGVGSYPVFIGSDLPGHYPHNIMLELLAEYGVTGFGLFMLPIIITLFERLKTYGKIYAGDAYDKLIVLFAIYFWIIFSVTGGLRASWLLLFFTFLMLPYHQKPSVRQMGIVQ